VKRLLLIALLLIGGAVSANDTTGYTGSGTYAMAVYDTIWGSAVRPVVHGTLDTMVVFLKVSTTTDADVHCAVYRAADSSLVDSTTVRTISGESSGAWYKFPFVGNDTIYPGVEYVLAVQADDNGSEFVDIGLEISGGIKTWYQETNYGAWADPLATSGRNVGYRTSSYIITTRVEGFALFGAGRLDADDTYIDSDAPATNKGGENDLLIYTHGQKSAHLLWPTLDDTLLGKTIDSAYVTLWLQQLEDANDSMIVYAMETDWVASEATWNVAKYGTNWSTAGALGSGTDRASTPTDTLTFPDGQLHHYAVDVTDDVQDIADGGDNYGWGIYRLNPGYSADRFFSADAPDSWGRDKQPYLVVWYTDGASTSGPPDYRHGPAGLGQRHGPDGSSARSQP